MFILNCVRAEENRLGSVSALAFMMQEHDIYHLVNHIWQGQSAVSKTRDLFILRMIRYQKNIEWAPWNCILLTKDEADIHYYINDFTTIYSKHLINQITLRHQIAKNYFKYVYIMCLSRFYAFYQNNIKISKYLDIFRQLIIFEKDFRESCRFSKIQNGIKYKPPVTVENYDPSKKYKLAKKKLYHITFGI